MRRSDLAGRASELLRFVGLGGFERRLAGQLSGGMKQKLGLSCALIHEPRILLLDELTFGVDPVSRRDLWVIVHEMVARGVTAVVSTAYMDEAERFDRLALLHRGRILALDTPDGLQRSLAGETLALPVDRLRQARAAALRIPGVRRAAVFGDRLHLAVDDAATAGPRVARELRAAGFTPGEWSVITPSLEDVFIGAIAETGAA
jgi:ABC-2 type transport system ATP-binding protein